MSAEQGMTAKGGGSQWAVVPPEEEPPDQMLPAAARAQSRDGGAAWLSVSMLSGG